jgi:uncharacterized membrane protein
MKKLLVFLFLIFCSASFAQIYVTNKTNEPIWVAIVTYQNGKSFTGYVSKGWYKVIPGERVNCGGVLSNGDNTYYVHAHNSSWTRSWGKDHYFAIDKTNAFRIENCDMKYTLKDPNHKSVGFSKNFIHIGFFDPYKVEHYIK